MRTMIAIILLALAVPLWAGEYDEAVKLIKQKKYGVAKTLLEATVKKDGSPKVRFALGFCHEKAGDRDKAIKCYRDAVAENLKEGTDADESARALRKLMELKPEIGDVLSAAQDLEAKAKDRKSEFMRQAARNLYAYALNPENWNLKEPAEPEPIVGAPKRQVPEGAKEYDGHRYHAFAVSPGMTWEQAREACEKFGGHLLCINGEKEEEWLKKEVLDVKIAYVGLTVKAGRLRWVDGKPVRHEGVWVGGRPKKPGKEERGVVYGRKWGSNFAEWRLVKGASPAVTHYICEWEKR